MFNLANNLTFLRIACIPLLVLLLYFPSKISCLIAMFIFIGASLTDLVDGIIARRYNLVTNMGKFLDPLADKLLVASALIMLVKLGWVEAWISITIVSREILVTGLRAIAADQGLVIAADKYGKLKTIVQTVALCPLILHYKWWGFDPNLLGQVLIYLALILTLFSGVNYLRNFYRKVLTN
ncbi:CDP-diacylglycerol--glycerol-3-phosphate 3-phosphatidyltransferase [Desulfohalobiaceae bacterium Ax17]|uniref:CDP-diacylglycerol--glycerol-3-phosphate 3-phosphatidyltransferase n=1 Tax=Desulfovulcanus ferrireducens TaxID=2831190 RepID=UPI00207B9AA5|nr:CDP-diacylglycerol--glycerol-3-phosphate 3-phosphatidyltransferase [Desulfovulcanus ferrireducens]MBT8764006.1 CDP-diacylglycerol--glycerol-3-phosphate 3-phosphatidyltransferase [Desulfovulcanus ferrireducens]